MNFSKSHTTLKMLLYGACILTGLVSHFSFGLAQGPFTGKVFMPTARLSMGTAVVDGKIYAIGGGQTETIPLSVAEVYDLVTDSWATITPMPTARGAIGCAVVDGKIYAIGGGLFGPNPLSIVEVYDPATDSWDDTTKAPMLTARSDVAACTVNGKIYVIGGTLQINYILAGTSIVEEYDPATNTWTTKTSKPTPGYGLRACVLEGKIYVTGGNIKWPNSSAVLEVYDPVKDEWVTKSPMSNPKYSHSICVLNDMIYSFGGWDNCSSGPFYTKVEVYNPKTDKWTQHSDIPLTLGELSAVTVGNKIYILGGTSTVHPFKSVKNVYEYNPSNDLYSYIDHINQNKSYLVPGSDSICITTKMSDPTGITIMAHIEAPDQTIIDSIELFDDGNHNDGNADDGLYANCWPVGSSEERPYFVDLKVSRIGSDTVIQRLDNMATFTTIGPVVFESSSDLIAPVKRDKMIVLKCTLVNEGLISTAPGIKAKLISLDTSAIVTSDVYFSFGDVLPGESVTASALITISESCPENTPVPMSIDITSNGYSYWSDTFSIVIPSATMTEKNMLQQSDFIQNYPNPCHELTTISFNLSTSDHVSLKVYDRLGKEVKTLVNNVLEPGDHAVHFNTSNLEAGMYIYTLKTGNMVSIKKMIVIH